MCIRDRTELERLRPFTHFHLMSGWLPAVRADQPRVDRDADGAGRRLSGTGAERIRAAGDGCYGRDRPVAVLSGEFLEFFAYFPWAAVRSGLDPVGHVPGNDSLRGALFCGDGSESVVKPGARIGDRTSAPDGVRGLL